MHQTVVWLWALLGTGVVQSYTFKDNEIDTDLRLNIVVKYPLKYSNEIEMFIRGNALGLSWSHGEKMVYQGNDTWLHSIQYSRSLEKGYWCESCDNKANFTGIQLQFRIFFEEVVDMKGPNFVIQLPVSASSSYFVNIPEFTVFPYFFTSNGSKTILKINSTYILNQREIAVYMPPSFIENTYKTYTTIFMFDLDIEFNFISWDILQGPIVPYGITEEYIILGFGDYGDMEDKRTQLMTPSTGINYECINGTFATLCDGCIPSTDNDTLFIEHLRNECGRPEILGGQGDDTLDFLLFEVLPQAMNYTDNRIDETRLGIMGYSLGGLMACHAAWTRPQYFKYAACLSPSLWWPANEAYNESYFEFLNITLKDPKYMSDRPLQKIYIDAGGLEIRWPFYLTDGAVEAAYAISKHPLFTMDENVWLHVRPDKQHGPVEFNQRLWKALVTLFQAPGDKEIPSYGINDASPISSVNHTTTIILMCLCLYVFKQF